MCVWSSIGHINQLTASFSFKHFQSGDGKPTEVTLELPLRDISSYRLILLDVVIAWCCSNLGCCWWWWCCWCSIKDAIIIIGCCWWPWSWRTWDGEADDDGTGEPVSFPLPLQLLLLLLLLLLILWPPLLLPRPPLPPLLAPAPPSVFCTRRRHLARAFWNQTWILKLGTR